MIVGNDTFNNLQAEWCRVKKLPKTDDINWARSSLDRQEFGLLHDGKEMTEKELDALFNLYDYSHSGYVTWGEFACTIALIMQGSVNEKIHRNYPSFLFNLSL